MRVRMKRARRFRPQLENFYKSSKPEVLSAKAAQVKAAGIELATFTRRTCFPT